MIKAISEYKGPIVDNHSHFMPGIDDGSLDMEMSMNMLRMAETEGITDLIVTSHGFYVYEIPELYEETFQKLKENAKREKIDIHLYKGCEVLCALTSWKCEQMQDNMDRIIDALKKGLYPTYYNTKYVLTEFYTDVDFEEALYITKRLQEEGFVPVLAHVERDPYLIQKNFVEVLVELGCLVQINAYSLQNEKNEMLKKNARYLLERRLVHFLGSDAHRSDHRPPRMKQGVQYVWENCEEEYAKDVIYRNSYRYLLGKE